MTQTPILIPRPWRTFFITTTPGKLILEPKINCECMGRPGTCPAHMTCPYFYLSFTLLPFFHSTLTKYSNMFDIIRHFSFICPFPAPHFMAVFVMVRLFLFPSSILIHRQYVSNVSWLIRRGEYFQQNKRRREKIPILQIDRTYLIHVRCVWMWTNENWPRPNVHRIFYKKAKYNTQMYFYS